MDYDSLASDLATQFGLGSSTSKADSSYDAIAKQLADDHGIKVGKDDDGKPLRRVIIPTPISAPISGLSKEESDQVLRDTANIPTYKGGQQTGDLLPPTDIVGSVERNFSNAKDLAASGLNDIQTGNPYKGAAKIIGGGALAAMSPASGFIEGGIEKPITELTGNPDIGSRAGFVASSALPIAPGAGIVARAIPKNKAFKNLVESIGPENVGDVAKAMRENPRLTPADLSPNVLQDTQGLFVTDGPHVNYLSNVVKDSTKEAKGAVEDAFDKSMGATVNPADKIKELSDNVKKVGATQINPVLKNTKPVDLTPVIKHIDETLKPGVTSVISNPENMLPYNKVQKLMQGYRDLMTNDKTVLTNPDVLNKLQSGMRRNAESLMRTPDAEAKAMGYALFGLRNKVIDAVDTAGKTPGEYRKGLSAYRDENNIADAFEHGHDSIIKNSRNLEDHPSYFKNWVKSATDGEKEAAREGAKVAIDTQINGFKSAARRGTDVGESQFNRERIEALFGKDKAQELFKTLENERAIADRNSKIAQGSQTAMRAERAKKFALPTKGEVGKGMLAAAALEVPNLIYHGVPGAGTAVLAAAKGTSMAKHAVATALAKEHNLSYAKMALPVQGPDRDALIQAFENVAARQNSRLPISKKLSLAFKP